MSWKEEKLGDLFEITSGGTPSRDNTAHFGGNIPWFKTGDLKSFRLKNAEEFITQEALNKSAAKLFPKNTVLFAMYGATIGASGILDIEAATNQACAAFLPSSKVVPEFLYYFFLHNKQQLINKGVGGAQPNLSGRLLKDIKIPLPPLAIQKKIAAVLEKADGLRRKREEQIRRLDDLLQATFLDMFGDPVTNPKGWEKCSLESLCFKVTDGTHQPPKFVAAGIPFLFVGNIVNGLIDFETEKFISEETFEELTFRTPIEVGDILYSTVGSYGKAVLVDTTKKFSFQRHIAHIKPDFKKVQPEFLLTQLNSDGVKRQADSQVRGIAQKTLNLRELKGFEIFLPPHEKQIEFIKIKKRIDKTIMELKGSCSKNQAFFNSLMQQAFKGELDLV